MNDGIILGMGAGAALATILIGFAFVLWPARSEVKPQRMIVQIAVGSAPSGGYTHALFALCADGTLWQYEMTKWTRISAPPSADEVLLWRQKALAASEARAHVAALPVNEHGERIMHDVELCDLCARAVRLDEEE